MQNGETTPGKLLIIEYERIKEEQRARIGFRDNLLYVTLAAMAAVIAAALKSGPGPSLLLLLAPVSAVLGWTYLVNDEKISAIGHYIRADLGPRLATIAQASPGSVFGWESVHRGDRRRRSRKRAQLAVDLFTFGGSPLVGLVAFWCSSPHPLLIAVSIAEVGVLGLLAWQIVVYADLGEAAGRGTGR